MLRVLRILFMKKIVFLLFIGKCFVKFYDQREREMGTKYCNSVESGVKHHKPKLTQNLKFFHNNLFKKKHSHIIPCG
jgi:hypothetical protein